MAATLVLCVLAAAGLYKYYKTPEREPWRTIAAHIETEYRDGDCVVVITDTCLTPFEYYWSLGREEVPVHGVSRHLTHEELAEAMPPLVRGHSRLWLVISHEYRSPIRSYMNAAPWATRVGKLPKATGIKGYVYDLAVSPRTAP